MIKQINYVTIYVAKSFSSNSLENHSSHLVKGLQWSHSALSLSIFVHSRPQQPKKYSIFNGKVFLLCHLKSANRLKYHYSSMAHFTRMPYAERTVSRVVGSKALLYQFYYKLN